MNDKNTLTDELVESHHTKVQRLEERAAAADYSDERAYILATGYAKLGAKITAQAFADKIGRCVKDAEWYLTFYGWAMDYADQDDPYFYPPMNLIEPNE